MKIFSLAPLFGFAAAGVVPYLHTPSRITNGTAADQGQAPFLVRLSVEYTNASDLCGGILVDSTTVITAAHCIKMPDTLLPERVKVYYGSVSANSSQHVMSKNITVHPDWKLEGVKNDVAVISVPSIQLKPGYTESIHIYSGKLKPKDEMQIYGWGLTKTNGKPSDLAKTLLTARVYVSEPKACQAIEPAYKDADGPQICTDINYNVGVDACQGDSGTGSTVAINGKQYYAGLVSYGTNAKGEATCGEAGSFGMYTHVHHYLPWIESVIGFKLPTGP